MPQPNRRTNCRVYCAGPLFNQAERNEMTAIADALAQADYPVYLPHRDGMEFRCVREVLIERGWPPDAAGQFLHAAIFALDIFQLVEECAAMVWNLNGRTPDEGAVSEAAIAWVLGKPLIAYKDDARSLIAGRDNPLLAGLVEFDLARDIGELPGRLEAALRQAESSPRPAALPPAVERAVRHGRELWNALNANGAQGNSAAIAEVTARLFAPGGNRMPHES